MEEHFLNSGEQTKITPQIQKLAEELRGLNDLETIFNILKWIDKNIKTERNPEVFRRRTSDQILRDKYATGCTDFALLYIALSRALKFPTKYVELFSRNWITSDDKEIEGHVIAEVKIGNDWIFVDPTHGSVSIKPTSGMIIYDKGLDSWDLGLKNGDQVNEKFYKYREEHKNDKF
jgi:transglutaminase-like putative cysteine protease